MVALAVTLFLFAQPCLAQRTTNQELKALRKEVRSLKKGQAAIQKELEEIKNLLNPKQPSLPNVRPESAILNFEGLPFKGDKNAKLTIVEFSDYQCPFCSKHALETLPQIEKEYVKTRKVKYVFGDLPLEAIHPNAFKAAEGVRCAGDQGKYWEMHDQLFKNQSAFGFSELSLHAQAVDVDVPSFQQCLFSGKHGPGIRKAMTAGANAGIDGTPGFALGYTVPNNSEIKVLKVITGAQPYAAFKATIDNLLNSHQ